MTQALLGHASYLVIWLTLILFSYYSLRHVHDPMSLWLNDKGTRQFNTQLRDLGYNARDIGSNVTKLVAVVRYLVLFLINQFD